MSFQTDGRTSLTEQQLQLQALETFFVEVIDLEAGDNVRNDVVTKDVTAPPAAPLLLSVVRDPVALATVAAGARAIIFDRVAFVAGQRERIIGFRPA
jgi:hypothetical protein